MILFLEIKYRGKKKTLGLLFCFTTSTQQGITENSLSCWEYWSSGTVNSDDVAVQFKHPIFAFHLTRTLHIHLRMLNLNLTYFKVASYLVTFTRNITHRRTLDKNCFYHCSHSEIAQHIFLVTPRSILGNKPQAGRCFDGVSPHRWASSVEKGWGGTSCQLPRSLFMPAWCYRVVHGVGRPAFQVHNRLICI